MQEKPYPIQDRMFRAMIENSTDAIALSDHNAQFTYLSPSIRPMLGYEPEELIGTYTADIIHPEDQFPRLEDLKPDKKGRPPHINAQIRVRHKNGTWRWIEVVIVVHLSDPEINAIISNFRDITRKKEREEEMKRVNESLEEMVQIRTRELQEANTALEAFIHKAAHDLQSPVRILCGYASLLKKEYHQKYGDEGIQMLDTMVAKSKYMSRLVADLLAYSRGSHQPMTNVQVDLTGMVRDLSDRISVKAGQPLNIKVRDLGQTYGDAQLLPQIWSHLIANAIKFSSPKKPTEIEVGYKDIDGRKVFFVADNGMGFEMIHAQRIFEVFKKLHPPGEFEGLGIGLALVRNIIRRHSGEIWVESEVNTGTTFYFTLPQVPSGTGFMIRYQKHLV